MSDTKSASKATLAEVRFKLIIQPFDQIIIHNGLLLSSRDRYSEDAVASPKSQLKLEFAK